jgi:hypothetical protein
MKHLILVLLFYSICLINLAQGKNCQCDFYPVDKDALEDKITGIALSDENNKLPVEETYCQWSTGNIILNNGEVIKDKNIRYDGFADQLIIDIIDKNVRLAVEKNTIQGFDIKMFKSEKMLHYKTVNIKEFFSNEYHTALLQVLVAGKTSLYAYRRLQYVGQTYELQDNFSYIIIKEDGTMYHFIHYSRRYIASLFQEKKDVLKTQLRKQHNRVRDEDQLIKAIELANSL